MIIIRACDSKNIIRMIDLWANIWPLRRAFSVLFITV